MSQTPIDAIMNPGCIGADTLAQAVADMNATVAVLQEALTVLTEKAQQLAHHERLMGTLSDPGHIKVGTGFERTADGTVNVIGTAAFEGIVETHSQSPAPHTLLGPLAEMLQDRGDVLGTVSINLVQGLAISATVTGATSLELVNTPENGVVTVILALTNGGKFTVTWPAVVRWPYGVAPVLTASGTDLIVLSSKDGGAIWRGAVVGSGYAA